MNPIQSLIAARSCGYLLHGSPQRLALVKPRQARDDNGRAIGCLAAVYATDDVRIAVVMAMFSRADSSIRSHRSFYATVGTRLRVGGENVTFRPGWVHVLPRNSFRTIFQDGAEEIISHVQVRPIQWIRVEPSIIAQLDVTVEFPFDPSAIG